MSYENNKKYKKQNERIMFKDFPRLKERIIIKKIVLIALC